MNSLNEQDVYYVGWLCDFTDGDGCFSVSFTQFSVSFTQRASLKTKIEVRPSFSISQKPNSLDCWEKIQKFFQCGGIRYSNLDGC